VIRFYHYNSHDQRQTVLIVFFSSIVEERITTCTYKKENHHSLVLSFDHLKSTQITRFFKLSRMNFIT